MFEIDLLHSFVTIVDSGGFTRAAERLNLTQSTVSAQLRRLEAQVGDTLLIRSTRSIALTPSGETLLAYARAILQLNKDARTHLKGLALSARIRIGASKEFAVNWLPGILCRFMSCHPEVTLEVEVDAPAVLLQSLDEKRLDVFLGSRCKGESRGTVLWSEPLVWAFPQHGTVPSEPLPLAFFPEPCPAREAALAALAESGRDWRINFVSPCMAGLNAAVLGGYAATPLPSSLLGPHLRALGPDDGFPVLPNVEFLVAARHDSESESLHELYEFIAAAAGRIKLLAETNAIGLTEPDSSSLVG